MQELLNIKTKISFGIIVLNGMPLIEYNLYNLYPFAYQIIVIEGACVAGKSLADNKGHSIDGTLEFLYKFKKNNDPDNKLIIVTIEDETNDSNFWIEKTEMCQAFAKRAKGDWLWQVDSDEFYKQTDMIKILDILKEDPEITGIEFPYLQFWGGFDYLEQGEWFSYLQPNFDRLFRWKKEYEYINHRPSTVLDEKKNDLRKKNWISYKKMKQKGIFLYHYSYILPKQIEQKIGYYKNVSWTKDYLNIQEWADTRYYNLNNPFRIGEGQNYFTWLERFQGNHPEIINQIINDIEVKKIDVVMRQKKDIEKLLKSGFYKYTKKILIVFLFFKWRFYKKIQIFFINLIRKNLKILGITRVKEKLKFLSKYGLKYFPILYYKDINGWLTELEAIKIYDIAKNIKNDTPIFVEIGSWQGKSSLVLAKSIRYKNNGKLYCVDPFNADGHREYKHALNQENRSLIDIFQNNMKKYNLSLNIIIKQGYSYEVADKFNQQIDLLFIDGNHCYESVKQDFLKWSCFLKKQGFILFHDVIKDGILKDKTFEGPRKVVKEYIENNNAWEKIGLFDSLFIAKKK